VTGIEEQLDLFQGEAGVLDRLNQRLDVVAAKLVQLLAGPAVVQFLSQIGINALRQLLGAAGLRDGVLHALEVDEFVLKRTDHIDSSGLDRRSGAGQTDEIAVVQHVS
jgi:hypothetical protein